MAKVGARMFNAPWLYWEGKEPGGLGQLTSGWFGIHISYRPFDDVAQVHSTPGEKDGDSTWPERTSLTRRDGLYRRNGPAKDRTLARKLGFSFHFLKIVCGTYHQQTHYVTHTHTETTSQRTFCTCIWAKPWERRWGDSTKNFPFWFFFFSSSRIFSSSSFFSSVSSTSTVFDSDRHIWIPDSKGLLHSLFLFIQWSLAIFLPPHHRGEFVLLCVILFCYRLLE